VAGEGRREVTTVVAGTEEEDEVVREGEVEGGVREKCRRRVYQVSGVGLAVAARSFRA
jgi:hypothetical protein